MIVRAPVQQRQPQQLQAAPATRASIAAPSAARGLCRLRSRQGPNTRSAGDALTRARSLRHHARLLLLQPLLVVVRVRPDRLVGPPRVAALNLLRLCVVAAQHLCAQRRKQPVSDGRESKPDARGNASKGAAALGSAASASASAKRCQDASAAATTAAGVSGAPFRTAPRCAYCPWPPRSPPCAEQARQRTHTRAHSGFRRRAHFSWKVTKPKPRFFCVPWSTGTLTSLISPKGRNAACSTASVTSSSSPPACAASASAAAHAHARGGHAMRRTNVERRPVLCRRHGRRD